MATQLGVGYVSIVPSTKGFAEGVSKAAVKAQKATTVAMTKAANDSAKATTAAMTKAGPKAGKAFAVGFSKTALPASTSGGFAKFAAGAGKAGAAAGARFGTSFTKSAAATMPGAGFLSSKTAGYTGASAKAGAVAGAAFSAAFKVAATGGLLALGGALAAGFSRLKKLDTGKFQLENLSKNLEKAGKEAINVDKTMKMVEKTVTGTPFAIEDALGVAIGGIAAGVKDIDSLLKNVADTAAFTGREMGQIGDIFMKIGAKGKASMEELNQLAEANLPIISELKNHYGAMWADLVKEGKIGLDHIMYFSDKIASGTAQAMGETIAGAVENLKLAFGKLGLEMLSVFGDKTQGDAANLKDVVNQLTDRFKDMGKWVRNNRDQIKAAFQAALDVFKSLIGMVGKFTDAVGGASNAVKILAGTFVAFKVGGAIVSGLSAVSTAVAAIGVTAGKSATTVTALSGLLRAGPWGVLAALGGTALIISAENFINGWGPDGPGIGEGTPGLSEGGTGRMQGPGLQRPGGYRPGAGGPGSHIRPTGPGGIFGSPYPGGGSPGFTADYESWYPGAGGGDGGTDDDGPPELQDGTGGAGGSGDGPMPLPLGPYRTQAPLGFSPDSEGAAAWQDALHARDETQAAIQHEMANENDERKLIELRNQLIKDNERINDAEASMLKKRDKTAKDTQKSILELGEAVKLDEDLGISKGLAGMAANLAKFLMNLAAAPLQAILKTLENTFNDQRDKNIAASGMPNFLNPGAAGAISEAEWIANGVGGGRGRSGGGGGARIPGGGGSTLGLPGPLGQIAAAVTSGGGSWPRSSTDISGVDIDSILNDTGGLTSGWQSRKAAAMIEAQFPGMLQGPIGGARQSGAPGTHNAGMAIDVPIGPDQRGPGGFGDQVNAFIRANAEELGLTYGIWRDQGTYAGDSQPSFTSGGHQDHIDFQFDGRPKPKSGSNDSIPSMLSPGEGVLNQSAMKRLGGDAVDNLNAGNWWPEREAGWWDSTVVSPTPTTPTPTPAPPTPGPPPASTHAGSGAPAGPVVPPDVLQDTVDGGAPTTPGGQTQIAPGATKPGDPQLDKSTQPVIGARQAFDAPQLQDTEQQSMGLDMAETIPDTNIDGSPISKEQQMQAEAIKRLAGFIPKSAAKPVVSGSSTLGQIWMAGTEVVNGLIEQGAAAAIAAIGAAGSAGGAAAPGAQAAGPAAGLAIGYAIEPIKTAVSYWGHMGAIVTDAAVEQLNPLGTPHWMGMSEAGTSIQGMIDAGKEADEKAKSSRSYDTGGILEPGGVGFNMSNRPEAVLTESQWDAMAMGGGSGNGSGVNIENVTVSDVGEMSRALSKRERLNTMRYTGIPR